MRENVKMYAMTQTDRTWLKFICCSYSVSVLTILRATLYLQIANGHLLRSAFFHTFDVSQCLEERKSRINKVLILLVVIHLKKINLVDKRLTFDLQPKHYHFVSPFPGKHTIDFAIGIFRQTPVHHENVTIIPNHVLSEETAIGK